MGLESCLYLALTIDIREENQQTLPLLSWSDHLALTAPQGSMGEMGGNSALDTDFRLGERRGALCAAVSYAFPD